MSAYEGSFEMADDMDIDEIRVRRRLLAYTDAVASETSADHRHIARRAMGARSASSLRGLVAAVVVIGLVALVALVAFPERGRCQDAHPLPHVSRAVGRRRRSRARACFASATRRALGSNARESGSRHSVP
jgi:hypothetical protein